MDLFDQLRTFVRVVEAGSLSAAARTRKLSLAAVSRQISALEEDLRTTLIVRTTRRLQLTHNGRRWYEHSTRLLRELDDARADVAESGEVRGSVVISAPITLGLSHVVPRVEALARKHPRLDVDVRLEDQVIDLVGDEVDIAVRGGITPPDSASVIAHPLLEFRRVLAAAPAYLSRSGTPKHPRDLERHDCLVQRNLAAAFTRWQLERDGETVEVTPRARLSSTAPVVLRDWAVSGAGIALLPEWLVPPGRSLRRILDGWASPSIRAWALHRIEVRAAPRIRAVVAALAG